MDVFLTAVIVISAILIVFAVIMQPSKDGGLGGLASGGVTDSVFGTNRNDFLAKTTWWLMAIFLISSVVLAKHKTRAHNEREEAINTRSKAEEASDSKVEDALNKAVEGLKQDADAKTEDVKSDVDAIKKDAEAKTEDVKSDADAVKKDAEAKTEDAESKVEEIKKDAENKLDSLKKDLPEAGK